MVEMRERAKQVIVEIARQSAGDEITGKVRMFKAFYFAHLYYVTRAPDYLTEWPIVHMPRGPGIDQFDLLLHELETDGQIQAIDSKVGPFPTTTYRALGERRSDLNEAGVESIRDAVEFIGDKTASQLSEITHEYSRSWQQAKKGEELNIYFDILREDEADKRRRESIEETVNEVFG